MAALSASTVISEAKVEPPSSSTRAESFFRRSLGRAKDTESNSNQTHIYDETDDELERAAEDSAAGRTSTQQLGAVAAAATLAALLVAGRRAA